MSSFETSKRECILFIFNTSYLFIYLFYLLPFRKFNHAQISTSGTENEMPICDVFVQIRDKTFAFGLRETRRVMDGGLWDEVFSLSLILVLFLLL